MRLGGDLFEGQTGPNGSGGEAAKNDPAWITRFIGLMSTLDWSDRLGEIGCPTLIVVPGAAASIAAWIDSPW